MVGSGDRDDAIRARAYALWMDAGRPEGGAMDFWLEAERQVSERSAGSDGMSAGSASEDEAEEAPDGHDRRS